MDPAKKFPCFSRLFGVSNSGKVPLYLTLLRPGAEASEAVDRIRDALNSSGALTEIVALLQDVNWRAQLVGAVALLVGERKPELLKALWDAADQGSWVSPQLAAVASMVDSEFEEHARRRLEARCPINSSRLVGLDWAHRHFAAGPESVSTHSAKLLSALVALTQVRLGDVDWLKQLRKADDVQGMLRTDIDNGGAIAEAWLSAMTTLADVAPAD